MDEFDSLLVLNRSPVFPALTATVSVQGAARPAVGERVAVFGVEQEATALPAVGTICRVVAVDDGVLVVEGEARIALVRGPESGRVRVRALCDLGEHRDAELPVLVEQAEMLALAQQELPLQAPLLLSKTRSVGGLCDLLAANLDQPLVWKQQVLEALEIEKRRVLVHSKVLALRREHPPPSLRRRAMYAIYKRLRRAQRR